MTLYLSDPIPVDRGSIRAQIDERAQALIPGLDTTSPGTTYDVFADAITTLHAEALTTLTQMLEIAFRGSLEKVDRIFQRDAVQATATGTLVRNAADAASGTRIVPAGAEFNLEGGDGQPVAFQTVSDTTFTGSDTTETVELIAVLGGTGGNGLTTVQGPAQTVSWFQSLTISGATSGGEDAEDDETYLNRGADERPGRAFTIVLPEDLGRWLRNQPGVDRALVVDNYDADTDDDEAGGHITAVPIDADGVAMTGLGALEADAQAIAVTGIEVHMIAPTYTTITVVFAGKAVSGFDPEDVEDRAEAAIMDFLDPANWGLPQTGDQRDWLDVRTVRFQDIVTVLNNVQGFDYYTSLTVNGGTSDVSMTGPGALPKSDSSAAGTVTAP